MKNFLLSLIAIALLAGCTSYGHTRQLAEGGTETVHFNTFFVMGKAGKISSSTKDGDYLRKLSVGSIEGAGDTDFLRAIFEAGIAAGKKGAGP